MDKITFEEYCEYVEKGMTVLALQDVPKDKTIKAIICETDKEISQTNQRLFLFQDCYSAIRDYPNQKDEILEALEKYEQTGIPFRLCYPFWESSKEPPKNFKFIEIVYR